MINMKIISFLTSFNEALNTLGWGLSEIAVAWIVIIVGSVGILWVVGKCLYQGINFCVEQSSSSWRKEQIRTILMPDYGSQIRERKFFIPTKFITTPPHNMDDPSDVEMVESAKTAIDYFLTKVLTDANTKNRFYCILAGAGMGKTTFSVNLVLSYIEKYTKRNYPYELRLVSLSSPNVLEEIDAIPNQYKTILILDALDENSEAGENITSFLDKLEHRVAQYRFVIMTSRTQFFPSSDEEPDETNVLRKDGDKGIYKYCKMYLSPFTKEDIETYLKRKYKRRKVRRKASEIIKQCDSLVTRPMLLAHMDDLLTADVFALSSSGIYAALIEAWITREIAVYPKEERSRLHDILYQFSMDFSLQLYSQRDVKNSTRMDKSDYLSFLREHNYEDYDFSGRSLINRDAIGAMKFSHKSFYEYFIAMAKLQNPRMEIPSSGYDLAWNFYRETVKEKIRKVDVFSGLLTFGTAQNGLDQLFLSLVGKVPFNLLYLVNVYCVEDLDITGDLLDNHNVREWLPLSDVKYVVVTNYKREGLSVLLQCPNLKRLDIVWSPALHRQDFTLSNRSIKEFEKRGVQINYSHVEKYKKNFYPRYSSQLRYNLTRIFMDGENISND